MKRFASVAVAAACVVAAGAAFAHGGWRHHGEHNTITLTPIGGVALDGAEISAYDAKTARLFVVNPENDAVDIVDMSDPENPAYLESIEIENGGPNSVAVKNGIVAVAVAAPEATDPGAVNFYSVHGAELAVCEAGALPDMVTFTPNGRHLLVANEGEPNDDYTVDPEGSVSVINVKRALWRGCAHGAVRSADFSAFDDQVEALRDKGVRIFGPGATVSQDVEPEYIAVSKNSRYAWVVLQENNAMAILDIHRAKILHIAPFGLKDHSLELNALDASNDDDAINIANWPVFGMYQPDAIATYTWRGAPFLVTANEGDARDYDGFSEELRVDDLDLDPALFPDAAALQQDENLGRLKTTSANGDLDNDGDVDQIHSYGARSFSIWSPAGDLIFDSGDAFERVMAEQVPAFFNANDGSSCEFDNRSDDKGPEPEGVVLGAVKGKTYAFIGIERASGGVMVYDISSPFKPEFVEYQSGIGDATPDDDCDGGKFAQDIAPEGLVFISKRESPIGKPLLVLSNEETGTVRVYRIDSVLKD